MAEREEHGKVERFVPPVADVDIFTIQSATSFSTVVKESRIILQAFWECEREFCGRVSGAE